MGDQLQTIVSDFDMSDIKIWNGWTEIDFCKICKEGPFMTSFEFHYTMNGKETYISEACTTCTKSLMKKDKDFSSIDSWRKSIKDGKNTYPIFNSYGLIDESITKILDQECK
jgi:hypothetical protein